MEVILTLNAGSATLKLGAFDALTLERILNRTVVSGHGLDDLLGGLRGASVTAVGHRVVHGGDRFVRPTVVTDGVVGALRELAPLDPNHLPSEISLLEAARQRFPLAVHVACFDTAFHHAMPAVARALAIPQRFGLRRYGFHGLSYAYLMGALEREDPEAARGRVVLAHLGSGASLVAVHEGAVVDTTMGFTPTSGIPMSTRCGDLDPGVFLHWMRSGITDAGELDDLVNRRSGLVGISGTTGDMRELLAREASDPDARLAVDVFCYQAKKAVGALAAAMGGVDTLVFSGGIGAHAAEVRSRITRGLEHLRCSVRVIETDEELMIAREVREVMS